MALLWACSDESTLAERFENSRRIGLKLFAPTCLFATSYQTFLKLLVRWTAEFGVCLQEAFRQRMADSFPEDWQVRGFTLFGVDGSQIALPRTAELQEFSASKRSARKRKPKKSRAARRKAESPQLLLTTMWHAGTGLPWDWRVGPSDASERGHLLEMIQDLPANALVTADAGFVGYEYLQAIMDSQRNVLIRVGANVKLLKQLGYARESQQTVWLWPDKAAKKRQAPLKLRLVEFWSGKEQMHLVTNLSKQELSDRGVLECYAKRWGIEVYFRTLKQTFGRQNLKSKTSAAAKVELQWSLPGLWAMSLYALKQLHDAGIERHRLSAAQMLKAYRRILRDDLHEIEPGQSLIERLCRALMDTYDRENKQNRGYPSKRQAKPPGIPNIQPATEEQQERAQSQKRATRQYG